MTPRSGQHLLSVCTAVLSLSLYNLHSQNTPPFLAYVMRQFLVLIWEIREMGVKMRQKGEDFSKPSWRLMMMIQSNNRARANLKLNAKLSFIKHLSHEGHWKPRGSIENVADTLIGFLKKCTLNDVFVVFNLSYAKETLVKQERG